MSVPARAATHAPPPPPKSAARNGARRVEAAALPAAPTPAPPAAGAAAGGRAPAAFAPDPSRCIRVRGAREHNLKNIDVDIPRDGLVVITGLSGSGKSSLAFDTIFAEGQRKYMESLSAYARQFLDQLKKPDVDDIEGLPPTIAIEQRSGVHNPRSTVATSTEIYDYLRLLYARCGRPVCWAVTKTKKDGTVLERCGRAIKATAASQIVDAVMKFPEGSRMMVLAPVVRAKKGFHAELVGELQKGGWGRVRVDGTIVELRDVILKASAEAPPPLPAKGKGKGRKEGAEPAAGAGEGGEVGENPFGLGRYEKHTIEVVVDRVVLKADARQRLAESIEASLRLAEGSVTIAVERTAGTEAPGTGGAAWLDHVFSERHACAVHPECALEELAPRLFSFNSPQGACAACHGLGLIMEFDGALVVPDEEKTLTEGAVAPWRVPPPMGQIYRRRLRFFCKAFGAGAHTPYKSLSGEQQRILLEGTTPADAKAHGATFEGVVHALRTWYEKTESAWMKEWLGQFMQEKVCPVCDGDRLRIESLHVLVDSSHAVDPRRAYSATVIGRIDPDAPAPPPHSLIPDPSSPSPLNLAELGRLTITDARAFIDGLRLTTEGAAIAEPILKEVLARLGFLESVGLDYLSLDRKTGTLSGGEAQRIRLATQVGSKLVGACYVLDEPTIGLHQRDNDRLIRTLRHLADIGNTVLVVEHDEDMIRHADWVLDIGPGPGIHGGRVVAQGTVADLIAAGAGGEGGSLTGKYLAGTLRVEVPGAGGAAPRRQLDEKHAVCIKGAKEHNLKGIDVAFPLGGLVCVTGVSGSGKSTLVNDILLLAAKRQLLGTKARPGEHAKVTGLSKLDRVIEVDQSPIGRTPRSNPATYTGIFDDIRRLFATTKEAKVRGYKPGRFSFNVKAAKGGGRCEACEGQGLKKIEMHFLPDVYVDCEVCGGTRYNRETLEVKYRGKSIAEVLALTVDAAVEFFQNMPAVLRFCTCLKDVGLGYITLGQPSTTLSGGEAQRIKLATELGKGTSYQGIQGGDAEGSIAIMRPRAGRSGTGHTLYVLDEPTTGLHFEDVRKLIGVLNRLADAGNTLVVIEHNLDVIKCADWIIDLGPEGGDGGGRVVAKGTPEEVAEAEGSYTGKFLKGHLPAAASRGRPR